MPHASNTTAPLLAQAVPSLSRPDLRWKLSNIAVAVVLLSIALAAVGLFLFRRRTHEPILIYFGLLCGLYAVRLLALRPFIRALFAESQAFWAYVDWVITCSIVIPLGLFLMQVVGKRFRKVFRWLIAAQTAFAVAGILAAAVGVGLGKLYAANNIIILCTLATAALFSVLRRQTLGPGSIFTREARIFIGGFVVWLLFVIHPNLLGLRILTGRDVEFIGFLVFVAALGYISAYRIFANEERLLAI